MNLSWLLNNIKTKLLRYHTPIVMVVDEPVLAIIQYILYFCIFYYIVIQGVVIDRGYESVYPISGDLRMGLSAPKSSECLDYTQLPYCSQFNGTKPIQTRAECKAFTTQDMLYPQSIVDRMNVVLFEQQRICPECPENQQWIATKSTFAANIELYSFKLMHSFKSAVRSGGSRDLKGKLVDHNGYVMKEFGEGRDKIYISEMLEAVGISLDDKTDIPSDDLWTNMMDYDNMTYNMSWGDTFRHQGIVLFINIHYVMDRAGDLSYEYRISRLSANDYSVKQSVRDFDYRTFNNSQFPYLNNAQVLNYHAVIRALLFIDGDYRVFSFPQLLLSIASATSLVAISYVILEILVTKIISNSKHYSEIKFWEGQTVNDIIELSRHITSANSPRSRSSISMKRGDDYISPYNDNGGRSGSASPHHSRSESHIAPNKMIKHTTIQF